MSSSFSRDTLFGLAAVFVALLLGTTGCGLQMQSLPRPQLDPVEFELPKEWAPQRLQESDFLKDLYAPARGVSACAVLKELSADRSEPGNTLLMLDNVQVGGRSLDRPDSGLRPDLREREERGSRVLDIARVKGRVDMAYNPLFQLGLMLQEIPDRKKFLELIDEEIGNSFFRLIPLVAWKTLITSPLGDVYKERNKLLEDKISEAFPGAFDRRGDGVYSLEEALPNVVLQNGIPGVGLLGPTFDDTQDSRLEKNKRLESILRAYSTPVKLLVSENWETVFEKDRLALASAVSSFLQSDPVEQACATVLLHRSFAQMLAVMGTDRLPMQPSEKVKDRYSFPKIQELLNGKDSSEFMVCPVAGSFAKDESHIRVSTDFLGSYNKQSEPLDLSAKALMPTFCTPDHATPYAQAQDSLYPPQKQFLDELASSEDWLNLLGSFVNFAVAVNPGSAWWRSERNALGYPLVAFDDINRAKGLGGVLPLDSHVLALGLLNLGVPNFLNKHMVYLNADNQYREMTDDDVIKIRISDEGFDRAKLPPKKIRTTLVAASRLAEMSFKLSNALWRLDDWLREARASLSDEIARAEQGRSFRSVEAILSEYQEFVKGLFGSEKNLLDLIDTSDNSIRADLERLKEASAMLLTQFENPEGVCFEALELDLATGQEIGVGECDPAQKAQWSYSLGLIAERYQSPIFERLRRRSEP